MSKTIALLRARALVLNCVNHARPGFTFCQSSSSAHLSSPPGQSSCSNSKPSPSADLIRQMEINALLKKEPDRLLVAFKQVSSMPELTDMIRRENKAIGEDNVVTALVTFATIHRESGVAVLCEPERQDLSILCDRLIRCAWKLDPGAVVAALHSLVNLHLTSKTVVVQTLLQLLRRNINQLTLQQILRLHHILTKVETTALVEALSVALPLVFRNQLHFQVDRTDTHQLARLFHYACQHGTDERELFILTKILLNNLREWTGKDAEFVLWGIATTKRDSSLFQSLADASADILIRHLPELSLTESDRNSLLLLIQRLLGRNYTNERLLTSIVGLAVYEQWSFDHAHRVGRLLLGTSVPVPRAFSDRYVTAVEEQLVVEPNVVPVTEVLEFCAGASVRVPRMDGLVNKLVQLVVTRSEGAWRTDPRETLQLALNLELNRCSSAPIVPHLDVAGLLADVTRIGDPSATLCDCLLLQALTKVSAWEDLLTSTLRANLVPYAAWLSRDKMDLPMGPALKVWFSDRYTVHNAYVSKDGFFVDHLLIEKLDHGQSQAGGESGSFSYPNQSEFVEDLISPTCKKTKPVAVIVNKGPSNRDWTEKVVLERAGFAVMEVPLISWEKLLEHERRPYLERSLCEALDSW